jgi:protein-L-isoaspartate O-methyltransferase
MVEQQLVQRGVRDRRVLEAMLAMPRGLFVPPPLRSSAYTDGPLRKSPLALFSSIFFGSGVSLIA